MRTQKETLSWLCSYCWASRLGFAAAVGRRFSKRKPPPQQHFRYSKQCETSAGDI